jgi:hypothetical protein
MLAAEARRAGIDHDQQLHPVVVGQRTRSAAIDEDVAPADVLHQLRRSTSPSLKRADVARVRAALFAGGARLPWAKQRDSRCR